MARVDDYFPNQEDDLVIWFANFNAKIGGYATTFGLLPADLTAIANDNTALAYMVTQVKLASENVKNRVAYKDLIIGGRIGQTGGPYPGSFVPPAVPANVVAPGVIARTRLIVNRIKANLNYTNSIGQDLGIIGVAAILAAKPKVTAKALLSSQIELKYIKGGNEGVRVLCKRGAEVDFTNLGGSFRSPFTDARLPLVPGQPEVRQYIVQYLAGNNIVGAPSDTVRVTTIP